MGIDLFWDDEGQTVMLAEFDGKWTWEELRSVLGTIQKLSVERNQIFGAIVDVRKGLHLPGGSVFNREGLQNFRELLAMNNNGVDKGPVVVVGMNAMVKSVFTAVSTFDKSLTDDVAFADTIDEARKKIYARVARFNTNERMNSA